MVIVHFQGKQLLLPILHGNCVNFQRKQLLLPIFKDDCVHFHGKQLLLPILHDDCEHFLRGSNCYINRFSLLNCCKFFRSNIYSRDANMKLKYVLLL